MKLVKDKEYVLWGWTLAVKVPASFTGVLDSIAGSSSCLQLPAPVHPGGQCDGLNYWVPATHMRDPN